jgi:hypothetical protein
MDITGPLNIAMLDNDAGNRELHLSFKDDFIALTLQQRSKTFQEYITSLTNEVQNQKESDASRQGMTMIIQFCIELQPHIDANEISLDETIVGEMKEHDPIGSIKLSG